MPRVLDQELSELLDQAEANHMCLAPECQRIRSALNRRIGYRARKPNVIEPSWGVFARREYWSSLDPLNQTLHIARALSAKHPSWVFSDVTAAAARGWNVSYALLEDLHLDWPYHYHSNSAVCHTRLANSSEVVNGIRVTTACQTLFDCLERLDFKLALPIADSALRSMGLSAEEAISAMEDDEGITFRYYLQHVIELLRFADPRSESGGESIARATMISLGFQVPELQVEYPDPIDPNNTMRVDFQWTTADGTTIIGELDGKQKYIDPDMTGGRNAIDVLSDERLRESRLSITGARIMRFSFNDVLDTQYFCMLLESFGVPRNRDVPRWLMGEELMATRPHGTYEELTPLECYSELM